jgi:hypothetical protein
MHATLLFVLAFFIIGCWCLNDDHDIVFITGNEFRGESEINYPMDEVVVEDYAGYPLGMTFRILKIKIINNNYYLIINYLVLWLDE